MNLFTSIGGVFRSIFGNPVVQAILLLLVAWVAASIAQAIVTGLVSRFLAKRSASLSEDSVVDRSSFSDTAKIIGKIVFAVVFLLFLPGALEKLGLSSVTAPLTQMAAKFVGFLPNIIAAVILIAFGIFLAKLVSQIISKALKKTRIDSLQTRANIEVREGSRISDIIAKIAYALIAILFVVAGVQVLNIRAISDPATNMVDRIFQFIPLLFAAAIIAMVGIFLGKMIGGIVSTILSGTGIDKVAAENFQQKSEKAMPASGIIGIIVTAVIDIIFVVAAVRVLGIEVLSTVGGAIIAYMPKVLAAAIVLLLAWAVSTWLCKLIKKTYPKALTLATVVRVAVMALAVFMAFSQLGISKTITDTLFMWLCIGGAAAFAIAFGVGGRDWAKRKLDKLDENIELQLKEKNEAVFEKKDLE